MNRTLFSSVSDEWATPACVYQPLDAEFHFDIDLCANEMNAKCKQFITHERNSLTVEWHDVGKTGWCNPPYTRGKARAFVEKAIAEAAHGFTTVLLLPSRTDTKLFHELLWDRNTHCARRGVSVRFMQGRVTFVGALAPAPFPSMIVIVRDAVVRGGHSDASA
jgi:phage N-6-adenine-methyltransferase